MRVAPYGESHISGYCGQHLLLHSKVHSALWATNGAQTFISTITWARFTMPDISGVSSSQYIGSPSTTCTHTNSAVVPLNTRSARSPYIDKQAQHMYTVSQHTSNVFTCVWIAALALESCVMGGRQDMPEPPPSQQEQQVVCNLEQTSSARSIEPAAET